MDEQIRMTPGLLSSSCSQVKQHRVRDVGRLARPSDIKKSIYRTHQRAAGRVVTGFRDNGR